MFIKVSNHSFSPLSVCMATVTLLRYSLPTAVLLN